MNFTGINLDLQSVMRRTYSNLLYQSTFANLLNRSFMQVARTSTPVIEVIKQTDTPINKRNNAEITSALTNYLATYNSVKVDLTELALDYSFRVSPVIMGSGIEQVLEGQMDLKDSQIALEIDKYGYNKLNAKIVGSSDGSMAYTNGQIQVWDPQTNEEYISALNTLKATLFNRKVAYGYLLGLGALEYAKLVSALTSVLKYETRVGVEAVDMGTVAEAYGISIFEINDNALNGEVGYFASEIATVGDMFFSAFAQYDGNFPGFPGYFVMEGNVMFGADVVRPEAIIKLVKSEPTLTAGSFDNGTANTQYTQTTPFAGTNVDYFEAVGLPEGLSINESSGAVTGTPTTAGIYDVHVYGIDEKGNFSVAKHGTITIA